MRGFNETKRVRVTRPLSHLQEFGISDRIYYSGRHDLILTPILKSGRPLVVAGTRKANLSSHS